MTDTEKSDSEKESTFRSYFKFIPSWKDMKEPYTLREKTLMKKARQSGINDVEAINNFNSSFRFRVIYLPIAAFLISFCVLLKSKKGYIDRAYLEYLKRYDTFIKIKSGRVANKGQLSKTYYEVFEDLEIRRQKTPDFDIKDDFIQDILPAQYIVNLVATFIITSMVFQIGLRSFKPELRKLEKEVTEDQLDFQNEFYKHPLPETIFLDPALTQKLSKVNLIRIKL